jgi:C4-dicarboxylate-specific signal transduction histidine kinase
MCDAIERLFQPVFATKTIVEGTGLGLSISSRHHPATCRHD